MGGCSGAQGAPVGRGGDLSGLTTSGNRQLHLPSQVPGPVRPPRQTAQRGERTPFRLRKRRKLALQPEPRADFSLSPSCTVSVVAIVVV